MPLSRRTFLSGLSALLGAAKMSDLRKRVLDAGTPILLKPQLVSETLYVYEGGQLGLGEHLPETFPRKTWRQYFADIGAATSEDLERYAHEWSVEDVGKFIDDDNWPEIYETHYDPMPAAYRLLRRLNIGPKSLASRPRNGRLDFFAGSNHPGSNDLWVEAYDDLTVSLLQARLIELKKPIRVAMGTHSVFKLDDFDHHEPPWDE
jgi:hypothetical protein